MSHIPDSSTTPDATRSDGRRVLFALALFMLPAATSVAQTPIDTIANWDGHAFISSFGVPNTATYGQTVTVGDKATPLNSFSFEIGYCGADVTMRGEVYAWDGTKATGPSLFESPAVTLPNSSSFQLVTFNAGGLALPAGNYVLFATTSRDQTGAPNSACQWGAVLNNSVYPGGSFVFFNNGIDTSEWTNFAWSGIAQDLAIRVDGLTWNDPAHAAPAASTTSLLLGFAVLTGVGIFGLFRRRRHAS